MVLILLTVFSAFVLCTAEVETDRQSTESYDSLNRYRNGETSSGYSGSGGYYPRSIYDDINQNRFSGDLSGREFRPPNVFSASMLSSPHMNPLLAQPRQYQVSIPGSSGLMPYQVSASPPPPPHLLQSPGLNSPHYGYGGFPTRLSLGEPFANPGQDYGFGNLLSNPYYGMGGGNGYRQSLSMSQPNHLGPYSLYGAQSFPYSSPYSPLLSQLPNYQTLGSYANQPSGGQLGSYYSSQFSGQPYNNQPYGSQYGYNSNSNGYSNYNNYNNYNGLTSNTLGSSQSTGSTRDESKRDERTYASASNLNENVAHSTHHLSNETPVFHSTRISNNENKNGFYRKHGNRSRGVADHSMSE